MISQTLSENINFFLGICKEHVLYTDPDVLFLNKVDRADMQALKNRLPIAGKAMVSYGREYGMHPHIYNTGVMMIDVEKFENERRLMFDFARNRTVYPNHDQQLLNFYFDREAFRDKRDQLPIHYNWKPYWTLEPTTIEEVKIVHFHGPKPSKGLEEIANCDIPGVAKLPKPYQRIAYHGICCNGGEVAKLALDAFQRWKAPSADVCEADSVEHNGRVINAINRSIQKERTEAVDVPIPVEQEVKVTSNATNAPLWDRLSLEESREYVNQDCSAHPFKHCCLGQCRQGHLKQDKTDVLWKWNEKREESYHLAKLPDVLDYFASNIQNQPDSSCNIIFAGDSLSSDHAMAASCQLLSSGYKLSSCNLKPMGGPIYGSDVNATCESNIYPSTAHFALENKMAKSCLKVLIMFIDIKAVVKELAQPHNKIVNDIGGLIVFNWGVHCNEETDDCLRSTLSDAGSILPMATGTNATKYKQWRFLFRETEPQHFDTTDGTYQPGKHRSQTCVSTSGNGDNWRNERIASILSNHGLTNKIQTIPLFEALLPLWQLHRKPDCTHYCYSPFRFDITWTGMLQALSAYDAHHQSDKIDMKAKAAAEDLL